MAILASCSHCGTGYRLQDAALGRKVRCTHCRKSFFVKPSADGSPGVDAGAGADDFGIGGDVSTGLAGGAQLGVGSALPPRVARKKKKKKVAPEPSEFDSPSARPSSEPGFNHKIPLAVGGVIVVGVAALLLVPAFGGGQERIKTPESFELYKDEVGKQFSVEYPQGWEIENGGRGETNPWARFNKGSARILIKTSVGASAVGDIMGGARADTTDLPDELKPVTQVHEMMKDQYADNYSNYEEQSGRMFDTGIGEGRLNEFTASGFFGSKTRGIRVSALAVKHHYTVMCDCPEADWEVCKPIFERVAESLDSN